MMGKRNTQAQALLLELARLKAQREEIDKQVQDAEKKVIAALHTSGHKSVSMDLDGSGEKIKGTLVAPQRVTYDPERLRGALNRTQWEKVTVRVLDTSRLEAAVTAGVVDGNTVAACSTVTDTKPYVRLSGRYTMRLVSKAQRDLVTPQTGTRRVRVRRAS